MKKLVTLLILISLTVSFGGNAFAAARAAPQDDLQVLHDVLSLIDGNFLQQVDRDKLLAGALGGMLQALNDPWSEYFLPEEYAAFLSQVTATQAGIGIFLEQNEEGWWMVQSLLPGAPAETAGLLVGDIIAQVDGTSMFGVTEEELRQALGGEAGSQLALTIRRGDSIRVYHLERTLLNQPTLRSELLPGGVGYVYLGSFGDNTATELAEALERLDAQGMRALLLDMRGNPGGLMQSVVDVASELLPAGPLLQLADRSGQVQIINVAGPGFDRPIAVLVNSMTASAAEILAGALHDRANALLVGERTYGKGVMQDVYELGENGEYGAMKLTTAEFFTPNGTPIQGMGLIPDLAVAPVISDLPLLLGQATLYPGLQNEQVAQLQVALRELQLYQGEVNGIYDDYTREAVSQVQQQLGDLVHDGVADAWTQMVINDLLSARAAEASDQQAVNAARSWLMGQVMVKQLGANRWPWLRGISNAASAAAD